METIKVGNFVPKLNIQFAELVNKSLLSVKLLLTQTSPADV